MQRSLTQRVRYYIRKHLRTRRWRQIVTVLAAVVVFCTTYALILPAITMSKKTYCGQEEHTHTDSCYENTLTCGQEEGTGHTHTDACYTTQKVLVCGQEEGAGAHTHTDACYTTYTVQSCEITEHQHSADCYDADGNLICGMEEHIHSDACFQTVQELTCGQEESAGHVHTDACYQEERVLTCGQEESGHTHTADCYTKTLVCEKEEHTHTKQCYSNPNADVETAESWEATLPGAEDKSEYWAENLVTIAQSQIDYKESGQNYQVDENSEVHGYTRYGAWNETPYADWNEIFVSFCLHYADIPETVFPRASECAKWAELLMQKELYFEASAYTPKPGDLIFLDKDQDGTVDQMGIVETVEKDEEGNITRIKTIEGDSNNQVEENTYNPTEETFAGYGQLPCYDADGNRKCADDCTCPCHPEEVKTTCLCCYDADGNRVCAEDCTCVCHTEGTCPCYDADGNKICGEDCTCGCHTEKVKTTCLCCYDADGNRVCAEDCTCTCHTEGTCPCYDADGNKICGDDCTCGCHTTVEPVEEHTAAVEGDGYKIALSWEDSNVLPEGTELAVTAMDVESEEYAQYVETATEDLVAAGAFAENTILPYIKFYDLTLSYEGEAIEPNGSVTVTLHDSENLTEYLKNFGIIHFLEDGTSEVLAATVTATEDGGTDITYQQSSFSQVGVYATGVVSDEPDAESMLRITESGAKSVKAEIVWSDGNANHTGDSIKVTLCEDGEEISSQTLNYNNGWSFTWTDLDDKDNYSIKYTTKDGYTFTEYCETDDEGGTAWQKMNGLTAGGTYVLLYGTNSVVQTDGSSLASGSVTVSKDGSFITGVIDAMQWDYDSSQKLQNKASSSYLYYSRRNGWRLHTSGSTIAYTDQKISATSWNQTGYLQGYNGAVENPSDATSYTLYGKVATPVINFTITAVKPTEVNPDGSGTVKFAHNKTIDYLGDGVTNPDTDLTGENYYRLYLDMTGKQEPMDLLFVVDESTSMQTQDMSNKTMTRAQAVTQFLNGSTSSSTDDGFLAYFLGLNRENKVSVISFYGDANYNGDGNISSKSYGGYTTDSGVLLDWTDSNQFVQCVGKDYSGTNYEAGLKRATDQLAQVKGNGHRKLMIFLSDGVPTYFMIDDNDVQKYGSSLNGVTSANVGKRWGTGAADDTSSWWSPTYNATNCKEPSKTAFDDFMTANPGITVYTIGVSSDINASDTGEASQSPEVLQYMATQGGGAYYGVTSSMDELKLHLESLFYPKSVTITDQLSKYVSYYGEQPDVKVTMTDKNGQVTTLWENGTNMGIESNGAAVFDRVEYTAGDSADVPTGSTGTVKAIFGKDYCFDPDYIYTLSFNVKATKTTLKEYIQSGSQYLDSDGKMVTGDTGTDYGINATSSGKGGYHSNTTAYTEYNVSGEYYRENYAHPVVQTHFSGRALPETGGSGTIWYTIGGTLLAVGSLLLGCCLRRKRERRYL